MPKYRVYLRTVASATVEIDVPDGMTDPEEIAEYAYDHGEAPTLGAQASGWGQPWSLDLGEWENEVHASGPHEGMAYVTDMDGNEITGDEPEGA